VEDLGCLSYLLLGKIVRPNSLFSHGFFFLRLRFTLSLCTVCELVWAAHNLVLTLLFSKDENIK
jgi:hypothetical protein